MVFLINSVIVAIIVGLIINIVYDIMKKNRGRSITLSVIIFIILISIVVYNFWHDKKNKPEYEEAEWIYREARALAFEIDYRLNLVRDKSSDLSEYGEFVDFRVRNAFESMKEKFIGGGNEKEFREFKSGVAKGMLVAQLWSFPDHIKKKEKIYISLCPKGKRIDDFKEILKRDKLHEILDILHSISERASVRKLTEGELSYEEAVTMTNELEYRLIRREKGKKYDPDVLKEVNGYLKRISNKIINYKPSGEPFFKVNLERKLDNIDEIYKRLNK